jgi:hypothetical protein
MSRPRKMHKPLTGGFNEILAAVAIGKGKGKRTAVELQRGADNRQVIQSPTTVIVGDAKAKK